MFRDSNPTATSQTKHRCGLQFILG